MKSGAPTCGSAVRSDAAGELPLYLAFMEKALQQRFEDAVVDVPDFPKPGVVFKDLNGVWRDPVLCRDVVAAIAEEAKALGIEAVAGIESRGFLMGMPLALALGVPFIMVRKAGKLPGTVLREEYALEYGEAAIEVQSGAVQQGQRVLVHDDVLATGGTAAACGTLVRAAGGEVVGWSFLIELSFLGGRDQLGLGGQIVRPLLSI